MSMIEGRTEWCISRQRHWGVPIPSFFSTHTNNVILEPEIIRHVARKVADHHRGTDVWWESSVEDLLPTMWKDRANTLIKGNDTLDVWFDSGTYWSNFSNPSPSDRIVYIEGSDQYRGWFQSSVISSVVSRGIAPFTHLLSHGFVLDGEGRKMSKSLGNVVEPSAIIEQFGQDTLRLWSISGSSHWGQDHSVSEQNIRQSVELLQRFRNCLRFIVGNLSVSGDDRQEGRDVEPMLASVDRLIIRRILNIARSIRNAYDRFDFSKGIQIMDSFIRDDLSAVYFCAIRNRLYLKPVASNERRSAVFALTVAFREIAECLEPIVPFLIAEASRYTSIKSKLAEEFDEIGKLGADGWEEMVAERKHLINLINDQRTKNSVGSTEDFHVILPLNQPILRLIPNLMELADVLSAAKVSTNPFDLQVRLEKSIWPKCPRCLIRAPSKAIADNQAPCDDCQQSLAWHHEPNRLLIL
jgi:isoleucyl-tRNA synthetase